MANSRKGLDTVLKYIKDALLSGNKLNQVGFSPFFGSRTVNLDDDYFN